MLIWAPSTSVVLSVRPRMLQCHPCHGYLVNGYLACGVAKFGSRCRRQNYPVPMRQALLAMQRLDLQVECYEQSSVVHFLSGHHGPASRAIMLFCCCSSATFLSSAAICCITLRSLRSVAASPKAPSGALTSCSGYLLGWWTWLVAWPLLVVVCACCPEFVGRGC